MRVLLAVIVMSLWAAGVSQAFEKWEKIASNKEVICYIDEGNISKNSDYEYYLTLRFEYIKPTSIKVTSTAYVNGKVKKINKNQRASAEVYTGVLDTKKNKIYVQTKHFITEDGNVTSDVSPADVFESDSVIFQEALAVVSEKFEESAESDAPELEIPAAAPVGATAEEDEEDEEEVTPR